MKLALDHAWAWFSLHATQRLQAVNFFLVATAFLCTAFVTAIKEHLYPVSVFIALLGLLVSYYFYRMERRIRSLIHASERALGPLQEELAIALDDEALHIVKHVEEAKPGEWKYSKVFQQLYTATGFLFSLGLCYSVYKFHPDAFLPINQSGVSTSMNIDAMKTLLGVGMIFAGYVIITTVPQQIKGDYVRCIARWLLFIFGALFLLSGTIATLRILFD